MTREYTEEEKKHFGPERTFEDQLTNAQLVELLKQKPPESLAWFEGCDGPRRVDGVEYDGSDNTVIITMLTE